MDAKIINLFIESVSELFAMMLNCPVAMDKASVATPVVARQELIGLIGMSGWMRGTVALILPVETACAIAERFAGMPVGSEDELTDAVAELVNILAGGAKAKLNGGANPITLSLPNVIRGKGQTILAPSYARWIELAFTSDLGDFHVRITMNK